MDGSDLLGVKMKCECIFDEDGGVIEVCGNCHDLEGDDD